LDAAEAGYRQALAAAAPNVPGLTDIIYCTLGNVLAAQGKLAEAVAAYRQAISIKPNNVEAYSGEAKWCAPIVRPQQRFHKMRN
jgi:cytochrome c-type biogenesis protein CcmH/NrfG